MNLNNHHVGLVTKKFNQFFYVDLITNKNFIKQERFLCKSRKAVNYKNNYIFVGDQVTFTKINAETNKGIIEKLIQRRNLLQRPSVANISDIYVTFSVNEPEINLSQLSKFLINAENLQVNVSLILTKCDLISEQQKNFLLNKFKQWGYLAHFLNISEPKGLNQLVEEFKTNQCSILMGPSGVGKTTILNNLIPGLKNQTASVSNKIKRGRNTTRNVELFALSPNCYIVDTPGFNLQQVEIDYFSIPYLFPEISKQLKSQKIKCKFRDCLHISEPGCILDKNFERYQFYKSLIEEPRSHYYQNQED